MPKSLIAVTTDGYNAFKTGEECPYPPESVEAYEWAQGYEIAWAKHLGKENA